MSSTGDSIGRRGAAVARAQMARISEYTQALTSQLREICGSLGRRGDIREFCRHSRFINVFVLSMLAALLVIAPLSTVVAAGAIGPLYTVPSPSVGTDRTYEETYRVLANNDEDLDPSQVTYQGYFENDYPTGPVRLGESAHDPSQVLRYAATADLYRTEASSFERIPYRDDWVPYSNWAYWYTKIQFWRVHDLNSYDGPPDNSGEWFVQTTNQYGEWRPVYNAEVRWNEEREEPELANPDTALVHSVDSEDTITRTNHVTSQYLAYAVDPDRVAVPMDEETELFPTFSGAEIPLKFGQGRANTVEDAWVGVANVVDGAQYRGRYVVGTGIIAAYVPYDYRAVVPDDYSRQRECTITHTHTRLVYNSTSEEYEEEEYNETHDYPKTQWAEFELLDSEAQVTNVTLDAPWFEGNSNFSTFGNGGAWTNIEPYSSRVLEFPPGDYNLTAQYTVRNEIRRDWGVTSNRCNEWNRTHVGNYTVSRNHTVPVTVTHSDAENLRIDVVVADSQGRDRVNIFWSGNQEFDANPWQDITLNIGEKTVIVRSPWRFYDVSRNTAVQVRTDDPDELEIHPVTHSYGDRWPAIHHSVAAVANVSIEYPETNPDQEYLYWEEIDSSPATVIPGTSLPEGVNDPDNEYPTTVYGRLVGDIHSSDLYTGESVSMDATSSFGLGVGGTKLTVVPMEPATLRLVESLPSESGSGHEMTVQLTNAGGDPIAGRPIRVVARTEQSVTTDANGEATFTYDGRMVRVLFEGDVWYSVGQPFYAPDRIFYIPPVSGAIFEVAGTVGEYIQASISNTLLILEWIALGLFAVWYIRYRRKTRRPV